MSRAEALSRLRIVRAQVVKLDKGAMIDPFLIGPLRKIVWDRWHAAVRAFWEAK